METKASHRFPTRRRCRAARVACLLAILLLAGAEIRAQTGPVVEILEVLGHRRHPHRRAGSMSQTRRRGGTRQVSGEDDGAAGDVGHEHWWFKIRSTWDTLV